jgi:hypothetical protein
MNDQGRHPPSRLERATRWLPLELVVVGLVVWSAVRVLHLANADAVLPGAMSTQRLTWFVWGQDRLANLLPALAWPVQSLRWNLAVQFGLLGLGWFGCTALFVVNHLRGSGRAIRPITVAAATLASGVVSMLLLTSQTAHVFLFEQQYAFALLLFLLGCVGLARDGALRWALGTASVLAAMMVNPSLLLFAPFTLLLPGAWTARPMAWLRMAVVLGAFAVTSLAMALLGDDSGTGQGYNEFSPRRAWRNLDDAFGNIWHSMRGWPAVLALAVSIAFLVIRARHFEYRLRLLYLAAPAFAVAWTASFAGNEWVELNLLYPRYFFPLFAAGLLAITAAITELIGVSSDRWSTEPGGRPAFRGRASPAVLAAVSVPVLATWWISALDIDILAGARPEATVIRQQSVDVVVGGYWDVWPVVIEARAQSADVYAVTYRGNAMFDEVRRRIAGDLAAEGSLTAMCLGLDAQACVDSLAPWSPTSLSLEGPVNTDPLVISVVAGTGTN